MLFSIRISSYNKVKELLEYLVLFVFIIYLASATKFVKATDTWDNILGLLIPTILCFLLALARNIQISKSFIYLLAGYVVYFIATTIKFGSVHPRFFGIYLLNFFIGYVIYSSLRHRFFKMFENVILFLSVISLFFWALQQFNFDSFQHFFYPISFSEPGSLNVKFNFIFFTVGDVNLFPGYLVKLGQLEIVRNPGFAWEPGAFAAILNLAIFCNLITSKFRIKGNFRLLVLIVALLTTFSTTGYSIFMLLILMYVYNQKPIYIVVLIPIVVGIILFISSFPFMSEKMLGISEFNTEELVEYSAKHGTSHTPQRLQSFLIDFVDFRNNPILGYGGHQSEQWTRKLGAKIATISGIGGIMATFGAVGLVFLLTSLVVTSIQLMKDFGYKGWGFQLLMILMISISYGILFNGVVMCFWLYNKHYLSDN